MSCPDCRKKQEKIDELRKQIDNLINMNLSMANQGQLLIAQNQKMRAVLTGNGFTLTDGEPLTIQ